MNETGERGGQASTEAGGSELDIFHGGAFSVFVRLNFKIRQKYSFDR